MQFRDLKPQFSGLVVAHLTIKTKALKLKFGNLLLLVLGVDHDLAQIYNLGFMDFSLEFGGLNLVSGPIFVGGRGLLGSLSAQRNNMGKMKVAHHVAHSSWNPRGHLIILSFSLFADVGLQQTPVFPWMAQSLFPGFQ